jgi:hypothetical protein
MKISENEGLQTKTFALSSVRRCIPLVPPLEPVQHSRSEIQPSETAAVLSSRGIRVVAIRARPAMVQVGNIIALHNIVVAVARVRSDVVAVVVVVDGRVVALLAAVASRPPA